MTYELHKKGLISAFVYHEHGELQKTDFKVQGSHTLAHFSPENSLRFPWHIIKFSWTDLV